MTPIPDSLLRSAASWVQQGVDFSFRSALRESRGLDYLLTWNLRHLANAMILARLRPLAERLGFLLPVVCTPLQLMGTIEYEG